MPHSNKIQVSSEAKKSKSRQRQKRILKEIVLLHCIICRIQAW